jgi:hypothetical protein
MGPKKKKKSAVRMMEQLVRLTIRSSESAIMSEHETGRLAGDLQRYLSLLKELVERDPEDRFWGVLHRVNLKILRYMLRVRR